MKGSEIRRLVIRHSEIRQEMKKKHADTSRLGEILRQIERRYYHETGVELERN